MAIMDDDSGNTCTNRPGSPLPQPESCHGVNYQYIPLDEKIEETFFSSHHLLLTAETLCWILLSKGIKTQKNADTGTSPSKSAPRTQKKLYMRARVVSDNTTTWDDPKRRVLMRYPNGSTYRVKRSNLIPVLEAGVSPDHIVVVAPETAEYRKASVVHTCFGESFLEIGCDFGPNVDRVRKSLTELGDVLPITNTKKNTEETTIVTKEGETKALTGATSKGGRLRSTGETTAERVVCLGIDKSENSIGIAVERYPDTTFSLEDALTKKGVVKLRSVCQQTILHGFPSVVAIDINGDRELPAVLQCIHNQMQPGDDVVIGRDWQLPRLLIVKSRTLYAEMTKTSTDEATAVKKGMQPRNTAIAI